VSKEKYTKEFRPMASSTNATTVHYGTTWDDSTLLEEIKQSNLELERKDGIQRHFRCDWQEVAKYNPDYLAFVEAERDRLGHDHPLFLSQYALLPVRGGGGFISPQHIAQVKGHHPRAHSRNGRGSIYVAGIDIAGESEAGEDLALTMRGRDATVITIAEVSFPHEDTLSREPLIKIVQHYLWVGKNHAELYPQVVDILKNVWNCSRVIVDATGIGEAVASFLRKAVGSRVVPFKFTQVSKSALGFNFLAAVNSGRLKIYSGDGSEDYRELMFELERTRSICRPNRTLNFFVDPAEGHDDYLISLALCVEAASRLIPRKATGTVRL